MVDLNALLKETEQKMDKAVEAMDNDLRMLRSGRATPDIVNNVRVKAYGTETPLNQLATITTPDAATIMIQPWDANQIAAVEKGLHEANIGLNPQNDGKVIRLNIPPMTEENRKDMVRKAHEIAENGRIAVRNVRRHANDEVKKAQKDHDLSDDEAHRYLNQIQEKTDKHTKRIDEILSKKEAEITHV